jgi:hypothetical protein
MFWRRGIVQSFIFQIKGKHFFYSNMKWFRLYIEEILRKETNEVVVPTRPGGYTTTFRKLNEETHIRKKYLLYLRDKRKQHQEYVWKQQLLTYQGMVQNFRSKDVAKIVADMVGWQQEYKGPFFCIHCYEKFYVFRDGPDGILISLLSWFLLFLMHTILYLQHDYRILLVCLAGSFILTAHWKHIFLGLMVTFVLGSVVPIGYDWFSFWVILIVYVRALIIAKDPEMNRILDVMKKCKNKK